MVLHARTTDCRMSIGSFSEGFSESCEKSLAEVYEEMVRKGKLLGISSVVFVINAISD